MKFSVKFKADEVRKMFKDLEKEFKDGADGAKAGFLSGERHKNEKEKEQPLISDIALYNEFGTENIPPRPFMKKALEKIQERAAEVFNSGLDDGLSLTKVVEQVGEAMKEEIKKSITSNVPPPNKPSTIKQKKGSTGTLRDTGQLLGAVQSGIVLKGRERLIGK